MHSMFFRNIKFNQPLDKWKWSDKKFRDMSEMFSFALNFNQDISMWDVSNVIEYVNIFYNCPIEEKYKPKFR